MIRRSPAERYIKYLLLQQGGRATPDLIKLLRTQQLDFVSEEYIEGLRLKCPPPFPFYPKEKTHTVSKNFLIREGIYELFHPTEEVRTALKVLTKPRVKEFLEAMLLTPAPYGAIATAAKIRLSFPCSAKVVESYKKYFWNTDLVDSTEMRALLKLRTSAPHQGGDSKLSPTYKALENAHYGDPRTVAADLPGSPLTALLAQTRMGFMPNKIELAKVLEGVRGMASLRCLEAASAGGYKDSGKALEWSIVIKNVSEVLETVARPDEELRTQLASILLQTDNQPVPSLHELSAGQHTVEMEPTKPESHDDVEHGET